VIDSANHVTVVSAMSRLARCGGWARLLEGKPLEDELDLLDAELLVQAGVLRRLPDDSLRPTDAHPWFFDPSAMAASTVSLLRQALDHAEGRVGGWSGHDPETLLAQGLASSSAASVVAECVVPLMPECLEAFEAGTGTLLDVGVGVAGFATTICQEFPGARAVGIDVLAPVLEQAAQRIADVGLSDRIELREQSVTDLTDVERFDLVWLPQAFIPPAAFRPGLEAVHRALRPGRWLVVLLGASGQSDGTLQRAVQAHGAHLTGGGVVEAEEVRRWLLEVGFDRVRELDTGDQSLVLAHRPSLGAHHSGGKGT